MMTKKAADKPIIAIKGFAVVVKDKSGLRFVRATVNGRPTVRVCTPSLADDIFHTLTFFYNREYAKCYREEAVELVKRDFSNTRICPRPPFKADVVSVKFQIG